MLQLGAGRTDALPLCSSGVSGSRQVSDRPTDGYCTGSMQGSNAAGVRQAKSTCRSGLGNSWLDGRDHCGDLRSLWKTREVSRRYAAFYEVKQCSAVVKNLSHILSAAVRSSAGVLTI